MGIRDSIKPITDKLQSFSLKIIDPDTVLTKIKNSCENELNMRGSDNDFDSGVKYMASKILRILNEK